MKLWQKIGAGFLLIVALNIVNFAITMSIQKKQLLLDKRADEAVQRQIELKQIKADHIRWKVNVLVAVLNESPPKVEVDPARCGLGRFLATIKPEDPEEETIINTLRGYHDRMHRGAKKMQALFAPGNEVDDVFEAMTNIYNSEINKTSKELFKLLDRLEKIYDKRSDTALAAVNSAAKRAEKISIILNTLMLITAIGFGLWIARSITKPVLQLKDGIRRVAQGDFSQDLAIKGRDEIAEVAQEINNMLRQLRPQEENLKS